MKKRENTMFKQLTAGMLGISIGAMGLVTATAQDVPPAPEPAEPAPEPEEAPPPPQPEEFEMPEPALSPEDISDEELVKASEVYEVVRKLNRHLQDTLVGEQRQEVIREAIANAEAKLAEEAEEIGIELKHYDDIMETVQQDQELLQEFLVLVEEEPPEVPEPGGDPAAEPEPEREPEPEPGAEPDEAPAPPPEPEPAPEPVPMP